MTQINTSDTFNSWRLAYNALDSDYRTYALTRTSISVNNASGYGTLAYNSVNGVITYTGVSTSQIRSQFSVHPDAIIDYDSATGQFNTAPLDSDYVANGAVTTLKLGDAAVTTIKIAGDAVDSDKIADNSIGNEHLQDDCVTSAELASVVSLIIYNSAGSAVKTLYGAGS